MERFERQVQNPQIKEVKRLNDGSIQLPYTKETSMGTVDFDLRLKKRKDGKVIIENKTPITENNKGYVRSKESYIIDTSSANTFAQSLGKALDRYVGQGRPSLSQEKREKAYNLLGFEKHLIIEKSKKEQENLIKEIKAIQKDKDLERDTKSKTLKFEYNIGYGSDEKIIYARLYETPKGEVHFKMEAGFVWSIAGFSTIEKTFKKSELRTGLPNFVEQTFKNGITYKRLLGSNEKYIAKNETRNNAINKAKKAAITFEKLTK